MAIDLAELKIEINTLSIADAMKALDALSKKAGEVATQVSTAFGKQKKSATEYAESAIASTKATGTAIASQSEKLILTLKSQINAWQAVSDVMARDAQVASSGAVQRRIYNSVLASGVEVVRAETIANAKQVEGLKQSIALTTAMTNVQQGLSAAEIKSIQAKTLLGIETKKVSDAIRAQVNASQLIAPLADAHVTAYHNQIKATRAYQEALAKEIILIQARNNAQMGLSSKKGFLFSPIAQDPNVIAAQPAKQVIDVYAAAGVTSPAARMAQISAYKAALVDLHSEYAKGNITAGIYHRTKGDITNSLVNMTRGATRARGEIRHMAAYLASLTFEATGAIYGITALGAALAAPAFFGLNLLKTMESTGLGMASILISMGRINGEAIKLPQALAISAGMTKQLQQDALKYGISVTELANTLRATLAPGLAGGMNLKQIQDIAAIGTLAVKTIGLDARQSVQEIRDLVAGGIQAASSTLATSLGIKDSDIKRWREGGVLYEKLMEKMQGFVIAGAESTKTLSGAWDTMLMKIQLLFASEELFNKLKESVIDLSNYIMKWNEETGKMEINKDLVSTVEKYSKTLLAALTVMGKIVEILGMILPLAIHIGIAFAATWGVTKIIAFGSAIVSAIGALSLYRGALMVATTQTTLLGAATATASFIAVGAIARLQLAITSLFVKSPLVVLAVISMIVYEVARAIGLIDKLKAVRDDAISPLQKELEGKTLAELEAKRQLSASEVADISGNKLANISQQRFDATEILISNIDRQIARLKAMGDAGKVTGALEISVVGREVIDKKYKKDAEIRAEEHARTLIRINSQADNEIRIAKTSNNQKGIADAEIWRARTIKLEKAAFADKGAGKDTGDDTALNRLKDLSNQYATLASQTGMTKTSVEALELALANMNTHAEVAVKLANKAMIDQMKANAEARDNFIIQTALNNAKAESLSIIDKATTKSKEYIAGLELENSLHAKSTLHIKLANEQRKIEKELAQDLLALRTNKQFEGMKPGSYLEAQYRKAEAAIYSMSDASLQAADRITRDNDRIGKSFTHELDKGIMDFHNSALRISTVTTGLMNTAVDGIASSISQYIVQPLKEGENAAERFHDAMRAVALSIADSFVQAFIKIGIQRVLAFGVDTVADSPALLAIGKEAAAIEVAKLARLASITEIAGAEIAGIAAVEVARRAAGAIAGGLYVANITAQAEAQVALAAVTAYAALAAFPPLAATAAIYATAAAQVPASAAVAAATLASITFAQGGVVDSPTNFQFSSGGNIQNGLMGEAGPEAIMPLKRGPDGKLGVSGGGKIEIVDNRRIYIDGSADRASILQSVNNMIVEGNARLVDMMQRRRMI